MSRFRLLALVAVVPATLFSGLAVALAPLPPAPFLAAPAGSLRAARSAAPAAAPSTSGGQATAHDTSPPLRALVPHPLTGPHRPPNPETARRRPTALP
ncbi:MAG: AraC family transcriptional regulator, partial [Chloroflexota bacterium]|nr:AraC family transcriptional regulator [Chloroflexota bacterium]